jgi:hypothetical protein
MALSPNIIRDASDKVSCQYCHSKRLDGSLKDILPTRYLRCIFYPGEGFIGDKHSYVFLIMHCLFSA